MLVNCIILVGFYLFYIGFFYAFYLLNERRSVKGNINRKGEKIYYTKDHRLYYKVNAEEYFRSEADAQKAGYRKPKR